MSTTVSSNPVLNSGVVLIKEHSDAVRQLFACCDEIADEKVNHLAQIQLDRFNLWASNIGVFARGHASLDYRLLAAPTARSADEGQLETLCVHLLTGNCHMKEISVEDTRLRNCVVLNGGAEVAEEKLDEFAGLRLSEVGKFGKALLEKATAIQEYQIEMLREVRSEISMLHQLTISIRRASNRNSLISASKLFDEDEGYDVFKNSKSEVPTREASKRFLTDFTFLYFIEQVLKRRWATSNPDKTRKWPRSYRDILLNRCKEAIVMRRKQLMYMRNHQAELQKIHTALLASQPRPAPQKESVTSSQSYTAAAELRDPLKAASSTTASSEGRELHKMGYELPPAPELEYGEEEKACPYCCLVFPRSMYDQRNDYKSWRQHLVEDMQPYICVYRHCYARGKSYGTFAEWQMHLSRYHDEYWICPLEPGLEEDNKYETEAGYRHHLEFEHSELSDEQTRKVLQEAGQHELPRQCFVCLQEFPETTDTTALQEHAAGHLEEIFVFALPWGEDIGMESDMKIDISSNGVNSNASNQHTNNDSEVGNIFHNEANPELDQPASGIVKSSEVLTKAHLAKLRTEETSEGLINSWKVDSEAMSSASSKGINNENRSV